MDGNRGAKGSIKDRLISMLYRIRYKKKKKKEEEYTVHNKNKQIEYIYNLEEFKETENINVLDSKDKKQLDSVEFFVDFKIEKKLEPIPQPTKIKNKKVVSSQIEPIFQNETTPQPININNLEVIDLKLENIENKNSELEEKVVLKNEVKKVKEEVTVLKEVEKFIEESKQNIEEIKQEIDELKQLSKHKNKDTQELEERYKKLKEKVKKLKQQYEAVKDKYDFSEFSILESIKLIDSIDNYKTLATLNEMEMLVKVCKKEVEKIDSITIVSSETNKVGNEIKNTKQEQNNVKIKFTKSKEKINSVSSIEEEIQYEIKRQKEVIDDLYTRAFYFEKEYRKEVEYIGYSKILSSLLKIAGGIITLPFNGTQIFGTTLGTTMINKGLKQINKGLEKKEKIVIDYKYEDISKQLVDIKDKVEYTNLVLTDSLNEIKQIKEKFKTEYSEFNNILNDYSSTLETLDDLEQKLLIEQAKLSQMDKKIELEKEINKQKLKKVN